MSNILVTGSSSGFGRLTSLALAKKGHTVFATLRDIAGKNRAVAEEIRTIAARDQLALHVIELDVTTEASVEAAIASALAIAGHLDVVINNAGYATFGLNETVTPEQFLKELDTNVVGMQRVNRAALPSMRARGEGFLVHVSSGLGRILMPVTGLYAATKWAVEALAETYRYELKPVGIDVSIVQPGAYPTDFGKGMQAGADQGRASGYGPMAGALEMFGKQLEQMLGGPNAPNPQQVADAIVALVETPRGQRPARIVVDPMQGPIVPQLNDAHAAAQKALLAGMGMAFLVD